MSTSLFLTVLPSVSLRSLSSCSLLCSTCLLIFCTRLKYYSCDKDPPLDTGERSHYTERRQSQLHSALFFFLSYSLMCTHIYKNTHVPKKHKTQCVHILYPMKDSACVSKYTLYGGPHATHTLEKHTHIHINHNHSVYDKEISIQPSQHESSPPFGCSRLSTWLRNMWQKC